MTKFEKPGSKSWDYPDMAKEAGTKAVSRAIEASYDYQLMLVPLAVDGCQYPIRCCSTSLYWICLRRFYLWTASTVRNWAFWWVLLNAVDDLH